MARFFNGSTGRIICAIGNSAIRFGGIFAMVRRAANGAWHCPWSNGSSASVTQMGLQISDTDRLALWVRGSDDVYAPTLGLTVADGWALIGASKASGSAAPRFHKYVFSTGVWSHETAATAQDNATGTPNRCRIGDFDTSFAEFFNGDIQWVSTFNRNLTDAEVERMAFSLSHMRSLAPVGLWILDQSLTTQPVVDWTGGGANQTSITGTSISTNHPPIWSYGHSIAAVMEEVEAVASRARMLLLGVGK